MSAILAEGFHPSEFIREELEARGWSLDELVMRMTDGDHDEYGVTRLGFDFYFEIGPTEPGLRLGDENARLMAAAFGVSSELFLNLERTWLEWVESPAGRAALARAENGRGE
jgi:plasmid maintenance system antidote protein VapI